MRDMNYKDIDINEIEDVTEIKAKIGTVNTGFVTKKL